MDEVKGQVAAVAVALHWLKVAVEPSRQSLPAAGSQQGMQGGASMTAAPAKLRYESPSQVNCVQQYRAICLAASRFVETTT